MLYTVVIFKKIRLDLVLNQGPIDLQTNALPSELYRRVVATRMSL